jgi:hypothetical protein
VGTTGTGTNVVVKEDGTVTFTSPAMPGGIYALTFDYFDGATTVATVTKTAALRYGLTKAPALDIVTPLPLSPAPNMSFTEGEKFSPGAKMSITVLLDDGVTTKTFTGAELDALLDATTPIGLGQVLSKSDDGTTVTITLGGQVVYSGPIRILAAASAGAAAVPTLGEWALVMLALMLTTGAGFALRHRKA